MKNNEENHLFSVQFYVKIFLILLFLIFVNVGISRLPLPNHILTILLLVVATIQAALVCLYFMELVHENKFYSFVWVSAILFMILFFVITLLELNSRGEFNHLESIHYMRQIDKNNVFAPGGPEALNQSSEKSSEKK